MPAAIEIKTRKPLYWQKILGGGESWVYLIDSNNKFIAAYKKI